MSARSPYGSLACWIGVGALLLVGACGGGNQGAPPAESTTSGGQQAASEAFDPCALLTASEIEAALGWTPSKTAPYAQQNKTGHCVYTGRPEKAEDLDAGIGVCASGLPCSSLPDFASSDELVEYLKKGYQEMSSSGPNPTIEPIADLGVPAIRQELLGRLSIEMAIGQKKLAYVETWAPYETARPLAEKLLARAR